MDAHFSLDYLIYWIHTNKGGSLGGNHQTVDLQMVISMANF